MADRESGRGKPSTNAVLFFIINNYSNLPDVCVFIKANVFNHCREEVFCRLIENDYFTPLESYEHVPVSKSHKKDSDGGYMEYNTSWYIRAHVNTHGNAVNRHLQSYNQFLSEVFRNPKYPKWIRFSPGGNYIVPKEKIRFYSKDFYRKLLSYVDYHQIPSEAHVIERALFTIYSNLFEEKTLN